MTCYIIQAEDNTKDLVDIPGLSLDSWREPGGLAA